MKSSMQHVFLLGLLVVLFTTCSALIDDRPPERSYNILMMTPISSASHRHTFMPIAIALTERGHKVTIMSGQPAGKSYPNITYVDHELEYVNQKQMDHFALRNQPQVVLTGLVAMITKFSREFYKVPAIKDLYDRRKEFDLFIVDNFFNDVVYPFVHEKPFISLSTAGLEPMKSAMIGNVLNPSYVCHSANDFPQPFSFFERLQNVVIQIVWPLIFSSYVASVYENEVKKIFPHLPPLVEIERNQSLTFLNSHFSITSPIPLLPSQIDIGGIHLRPPKPIPEDIVEFLSGEEPVIYFSFGSVVRGAHLPPKFRDIVLSVFARLPYKILWQFDTQIHNASDNVMIKPWFPQQDILAHPNVKLFVSHGGMLATQEALYYGKPLVNLPVWVDQPRNSKRLQNAGISIMLVWEYLTEDDLYSAISEVMTNPKYRKNAEKLSAIFRDQPDTALERAVYWTEYVIRHKGAHHMRSPALHLSWFTFLNIDVLLFLCIVTLTVILGVIYALKSFIYMLIRTFLTFCKKRKLKKN